MQEIGFAPADNEDGGITWLELFIMFSIYDQTTFSNTQANMANQSASLVKKFKMDVNKMVSLCVIDEDQTFFRTAKVRQTRLYPFGYTNRTPAIRWLPVIDNKMAQSITTLLLCFNGKLKPNKLKALDADTLIMPQRKISLKVAPTWEAFAMGV